MEIKHISTQILINGFVVYLFIILQLAKFLLFSMSFFIKYKWK